MRNFSMKRKALIALLALGTVGGFASGFRSMGCRAKHRQQAFERHVAEVCVQAAKNVDGSTESPAVDEDRPFRRGHRSHGDH